MGGEGPISYAWKRGDVKHAIYLYKLISAPYMGTKIRYLATTDNTLKQKTECFESVISE